MNGTAKQDSHIRHTRDFTPPIGMSALDQAKRSPGVCLTRVYEMVKDRSQTTLRKDPDEILASGAAVGIDDEEICRHLQEGMAFKGFCLGQTEDRAVVQTRGSVILSIPGVTEGDRGKPVYATGPNSFSLRSSDGAVEIGAVRHVEENGRAAVAFRATGDSKPLDLDVRN